MVKNIVILFVLTFFSINVNSEATNKDDLQYTESTEELLVREVTIDTENHPGNKLYEKNGTSSFIFLLE